MRWSNLPHAQLLNVHVVAARLYSRRRVGSIKSINACNAAIPPDPSGTPPGRQQPSVLAADLHVMTIFSPVVTKEQHRLHPFRQAHRHRQCGGDSSDAMVKCSPPTWRVIPAAVQSLTTSGRTVCA